jgi:hypothetical protein
MFLGSADTMVHGDELLSYNDILLCRSSTITVIFKKKKHAFGLKKPQSSNGFLLRLQAKTSPQVL